MSQRVKHFNGKKLPKTSFYRKCEKEYDTLRNEVVQEKASQNTPFNTVNKNWQVSPLSQTSTNTCINEDAGLSVIGPDEDSASDFLGEIPEPIFYASPGGTNINAM